MNTFDCTPLDQKCLLDMSKNGIVFSGPIISDEKIHRFSSDLKKNKKDEWYIAYRGLSLNNNEYLTCVYGSWNNTKTVDSKYIFNSWDEDSAFDKVEREHLQHELQKRKKIIENELQELKSIAAIEANRIWNESKHTQPIDAHSRYCVMKKIKPLGVRFGENPQGYPSIIIPVYNVKGYIRSLQFISVSNDGAVYKTFLTNGEKSGNFFVFGTLVDGESISVAEGYSTAYTAFEAYEEARAVVVAFDCHNLNLVIANLRYAYPKSPIIICGDDDIGTQTNPGRAKAEEAARNWQATAVFPKFLVGMQKDSLGKFYTDFNDLATVAGINEVKRQLSVSCIPDWVAEFNKTHAIIHTGQTYILTEKYDPQLKRETFSLEPISSFHAWYKPKKDPSGKFALSKLWVEHQCRREYRGIIFDPSTEGHYGGYYNLFQGFPITAKQGECGLFWRLIKEGLCACCEVKYLYTRKWLAHMIQRPWELPETAIAFRGQQGIGKGTVLQYLARLVGKHYLELVQMDQVVGRFNGHLKDVILVYANEAVWGGTKSAAGALKAMITDAYQAIELKGKDIMTIQNFKRLLLSSNEDWIVPRDIDDRRFFVIDCATRFKEDHQFFKELHAQMTNGGLEALMYDLMHEDIGDWHPRKMPIIADGFDLKIRGMNSPQQWLYYSLRDGKMRIDDTNDSWPLNEFIDVSKARIYNNYKLYCEEQKDKPEHDALFWRRVREVLGEMQEQRPHGLPRTIKFPSLALAREMFQKHAKAERNSLWEY